MKRFIPFLTIVIAALFNSCSKDDDMLVNSLNQKETNSKLLAKGLNETDKSDSSAIVRDTIVPHNIRLETEDHQPEEDPPVKNGNHWFTKNNFPSH